MEKEQPTLVKQPSMASLDAAVACGICKKPFGWLRWKASHPEIVFFVCAIIYIWKIDIFNIFVIVNVGLKQMHPC